MFNPKQPGCLWDGELKARHFVEFTSDSIDKCARVHDVIPLEDMLSGPSYWAAPRIKARHTPPDSQPLRTRNALKFRRFTRSSCEHPRTFASHRGTITTTSSLWLVVSGWQFVVD